MNKFTMLISFIASLIFGFLMVTMIRDDYPLYLPICLALVWGLQLLRIGYLAHRVKNNIQSRIGSVSGRDVVPTYVEAKKI